MLVVHHALVRNVFATNQLGMVPDMILRIEPDRPVMIGQAALMDHWPMVHVTPMNQAASPCYTIRRPCRSRYVDPATSETADLPNPSAQANLPIRPMSPRKRERE